MNEHKKFRFPHIHEYLVVVTMLLIACLLTYVIPAGEYAREEMCIRDSYYCT